MSSQDNGSALDKLVTAYEKMLERVHETLQRAENQVPTLKQNLEQAREKAVELGELTREEAERVASYVERDMHDAATFITETGQQLREWWQFDLKHMEQRMLDMFASVADQTSIQLREWAEQARQAPAYRTGDVTGPGTLVCEACGEGLTFVKAGRIPTCPKWGGTGFKRGTATPA